MSLWQITLGLDFPVEMRWGAHRTSPWPVIFLVLAWDWVERMMIFLLCSHLLEGTSIHLHRQEFRKLETTSCSGPPQEFFVLLLWLVNQLPTHFFEGNHQLSCSISLESLEFASKWYWFDCKNYFLNIYMHICLSIINWLIYIWRLLLFGYFYSYVYLLRNDIFSTQISCHCFIVPQIWWLSLIDY